MLEMSRGRFFLPLLATILLVSAPLRAQEPSPSEPKPPESTPVESEREAPKEGEGNDVAPSAPAPSDAPAAPAPTPTDAPAAPAAVPEEEVDTDINESELDDTIVEYDESGAKDKVTDAQGNEIKGVVVSKDLANQVQDPNALEPGADKSTGVRGRVVSRQPKKVLEDAPVIAKGDDGKIRTSLSDARGAYQLYLPPGRYTLRSYYDFYNGARWDDILVKRGEWKTVNFVLSPITIDDSGVEELEVAYLADTSSEQAQLNIRKEQVSIQDAISSQEIKRAGDSDAAGAAKRVVGVLIHDDGRIIIRGLQSRYNPVLLNAMRVPSTHPDIPGVRLDTFPSDLISNLAVIKVARPDVTGAFGGGVVDIETAAYPLEFELSAGFGVEGNSVTTFRDRADYNGGRLDWLGFDDGTRSKPAGLLPDLFRQSTVGTPTAYPTRESLIPIERAFPNIWNVHYRKAHPGFDFNLTVGDTVSLSGGRSAGYKATVIYDLTLERERRFQLQFTPGGVDSNGITIQKEWDHIEVGKEKVRTGAFATAYYEATRDSRLSTMLMYTHTGADEAANWVGQNVEDSSTPFPIRKTNFEFSETALLLGQLSGDHQNITERGTRLRWKTFGAWGTELIPDRRVVSSRRGTNLDSIGDDTIDDAIRLYSNLRQFTLGGELSARIPAWERAYVTFGGSADYEPRKFDIRRFSFEAEPGHFRVGDPEVLFAPDTFGDSSRVQEVTVPNDGYKANQSVAAVFGMLETSIGSNLKLLGGARLEVFHQSLVIAPPVPQLVPTPGSQAEIDLHKGDVSRLDVNPLPSVMASYELPKDMFLKAAYSMTVNRPALREVASFSFTDFRRGWFVSGNPDLNSAQIHNAELRWEWYFGGTNLVAVTGFYKYLNQPIEFSIVNPVNQTATYINADHAYIFGTELETRLGFGTFTEKLKNFSVAANITALKSETTLPDDAITAGLPTRRLFGAAPFVSNVSLRFDHPDSGVMVNLVYNVFGRYLAETGTRVGENVSPDIDIDTFHELNLNVNWKMSEHASLRFKFKNLLFDTWDFVVKERVVQREWVGADVSAKFTYSY